MEFKDQIVLVTGGTRGIGEGIATHFWKGGAKVVATYVGNEEAARRLQEERKENFWVQRCDTGHAKDVEALFSWMEDRFESHLHVAVANAGIRRDAVLGLMSEKDWDSVIETNLKGTYLTLKAAIGRMSRQKYGRIVVVTSPSGRLGFPGQGNYGASKAGQVGLVRSVSQEVARRGITVNCVSPGFIETDFIRGLQAELKEKYRGLVPMGRFGTIPEVVSAVSFLASKEASYVTGSVLEVTGGL